MGAGMGSGFSPNAGSMSGTPDMYGRSRLQVNPRLLGEPVVQGRVHPVVGDNTCGFSALQIVLSECPGREPPSNALEFRQILVRKLPDYWDDIANNPKLSERFHARYDYNALEKYQQAIARPDTWLGDTLREFELFIIASEFRVRIAVAKQETQQSGREDGVRFADYTFYASLTSPEWPGRVQAPIFSEVLPLPILLDTNKYLDFPVVYLLLSGDHYDAIVPEYTP